MTNNDVSGSSAKKITQRYLHKNQRLSALVDKVKLWPSRTGILHGVKRLSTHDTHLKIITHCGEEFSVYDSKNSRSARWLRNRLYKRACPRCKVPNWKLEKYSQTVFTSAPKKSKRG